MALEQYLGTLPPAHTQAEAIQGWPTYIRVYPDRVLAVGVGPPVPSACNLQRILGRPLLYVCLEEDCNNCVQGLKKVVDAYLAGPTPPPGLRATGIPPEWWIMQGQPGRT
jgi:hypothetical protein